MKPKNKEGGGAFRRRHYYHLPAYYYPTLDNSFSRFKQVHIENIYCRAPSSAKREERQREGRGVEEEGRSPSPVFRVCMLCAAYPPGHPLPIDSGAADGPLAGFVTRSYIPKPIPFFRHITVYVYLRYLRTGPRSLFHSSNVLRPIPNHRVDRDPEDEARGGRGRGKGKWEGELCGSIQQRTIWITI